MLKKIELLVITEKMNLKLNCKMMLYSIKTVFRLVNYIFCSYFRSGGIQWIYSSVLNILDARVEFSLIIKWGKLCPELFG